VPVRVVICVEGGVMGLSRWSGRGRGRRRSRTLSALLATDGGQAEHAERSTAAIRLAGSASGLRCL
jgi:hypothetical protein